MKLERQKLEERRRKKRKEVERKEAVKIQKRWIVLKDKKEAGEDERERKIHNQ